MHLKATGHESKRLTDWMMGHQAYWSWKARLCSLENPWDPRGRWGAWEPGHLQDLNPQWFQTSWFKVKDVNHSATNPRHLGTDLDISVLGPGHFGTDLDISVLCTGQFGTWMRQYSLLTTIVWYLLIANIFVLVVL